jgi:PEP-CTERM motif
MRSPWLHTPSGLALDGLNHLLVTNEANNTVGQYDATTGATINATFINSGQGLSGPVGLGLDGNNHLFVTNSDNKIGEFNATTGATINAAFINGQGLNGPGYIVFVPAVPEPGSLALLSVAAAAVAWAARRCRRAFRAGA